MTPPSTTLRFMLEKESKMATIIFYERTLYIFSKSRTVCQRSFRELYYIWYYNFLRSEGKCSDR